MESIKTKRAIILQDTVQYYSQDPEGRRCKNDYSCNYSPKTIGKEETSEGCAVGRLLSPKLREYLDKEYEGKGGVSNDDLFSKLPQEVQDLGQEFLSRLQGLHDTDRYWYSEGLTEIGVRAVRQIEKDYCI